MLTLTLNSVAIPIPPDFSMQLTWKSPVCDFEKIPQGYGQGFSFPINEHTRALFGNPERFSKYRSGADQKFPGFEVRFSGVLLMAGTLKINSCSKEAYEATLIDQLGVLGEKEAERNILEIPEFDWLHRINFENASAFPVETSPFACFPVRNPGFFRDKGKTVELERTVPPNTEPEKYDTELMSAIFDRTVKSRINDLDGTGKIKDVLTNIHVLEAYNSAVVEFGDEVVVVTPFFYVGWVLKTILKDSQFSILENYLQTDEALKHLCIYNNYDIVTRWFNTLNRWDWGYWSGKIENEMYKSLGAAISQYASYYLGGGMNMQPVTPSNHLPKMKTGEFLIGLQNLWNVVFDFLPNKTINIYSRENILKGQAFDLDAYFDGEWAIGEKKCVALKFVREHDDGDMIFAERFNDLSDRRKDIKPSVASWLNLKTDIANPTPGEIRYIYNKHIFAEYKWISQSYTDPVSGKEQTNEVLGWEEISIGFQNGWYEYGREEVEEIKTDFSTVATGWDGLNTLDGLVADQAGNLDLWKSKKVDFKPRLMFSTSDAFNQGSNTYSKPNYVGTISMEYESIQNQTDGLFHFYWKNWLPFWANRLPVTGSFDVPVNVLRYLIYNICKKYRTREGEFIIEEMSCEISVDKIGVLEVKGYKV